MESLQVLHKVYSKNGKVLSDLKVVIDVCSSVEGDWLVSIINANDELITQLSLPGTMSASDIYALFGVADVQSAAVPVQDGQCILIPNIGQQIQSIHLEFFKEESVSKQNDVSTKPESINPITLSKEIEKAKEFVGVDDRTGEVIIKPGAHFGEREYIIPHREEIPFVEIQLADDYTIENILSGVYKMHAPQIEGLLRTIKYVVSLVNEKKSYTFNSHDWMDKVSPSFGGIEYSTIKERVRNMLNPLCVRGLIYKSATSNLCTYTINKEFIDSFKDITDEK